MLAQSVVSFKTLPLFFKERLAPLPASRLLVIQPRGTNGCFITITNYRSRSPSPESDNNTQSGSSTLSEPHQFTEDLEAPSSASPSISVPSTESSVPASTMTVSPLSEATPVAHTALTSIRTNSVPALTSTDIRSLRTWEAQIETYFAANGIAADCQVAHASMGLSDPKAVLWFATERTTYMAPGKTFSQLFTALITEFAPDDWATSIRLSLTAMSQTTTFVDFAMDLRLQNGYLPTANRLNDSRLKEILEMGMKPSLRTQCLLDSTWRSMALHTFIAHGRKYEEHAATMAAEQIATAAATRKARAPPPVPATFRTNTTPRSHTPRTNSSGAFRSPALTAAEISILNDCQGCRKCRQLWVKHQSTDCPNGFPPGPVNLIRTPKPISLEQRQKRSTFTDGTGKRWKLVEDSEDSSSEDIHSGSDAFDLDDVAPDLYVDSLYVDFIATAPNCSLPV